MARLIVAAAIALAFFGGPGLPARQPASSSDETARINAWFEKKYEEQLAFSPIQQTFLGRKSAAIDDMSIAAQDKQLAWQRASVAEMKQAFDYAKLTPEAQTSYDLWIYQLQQAEASLPFRSNAYVFDQMSAIHAFFPQLLIAFHRVDDTADLEVYVTRIRESGRAMRQLIEISKRNVVGGCAAAALLVRLRHRRIDEDRHRRAVRQERHRQRGVGRRQGQGRRPPEERHAR